MNLTIGDFIEPTIEGDVEANLLFDAYCLLEPQGNWCTHHMAKNELGEEAEPSSKYAIAWCAAGALSRTRNFSDFSDLAEPDRYLISEANMILTDHGQQHNAFALARLNDELGKDWVLHCYENAISRRLDDVASSSWTPWPNESSSGSTSAEPSRASVPSMTSEDPDL